MEGWKMFSPHLAEKLVHLIPESYMDLEFVQHDLVLSKSPKEGISELLKLFIFRLSNNLHKNDTKEQHKSGWSTWNIFKMFLYLIGLENMPLLDMSANQPLTILSFLDTLFKQSLKDILGHRNPQDDNSASNPYLKRNAIQVMEWVLKCGYNPNKIRSWQAMGTLLIRPLQLAVWYGNLELVRLLLDYKARSEAYTNSIWLSPIQLALGDRINKQGNIHHHGGTSEIIIQLLLQSGVGKDPSQRIPILETAIRRGRKDIILMFLDQQWADFRFRLPMREEGLFGEATVLTAAAQITKSAACVEWDYTALGWFFYILGFLPPGEQESLLFGRPNSSTDLLISAANAGNNDIFQYLLSRGANINRENIFGITTLHAAVAGGHLETCTLLLRHGYRLNDNRVNQASILHLAFLMANVDVLMFLVDAGLDPNAQIDEKGAHILCRCTGVKYHEECSVRYFTYGRITRYRTALGNYINYRLYLSPSRNWKLEWDDCAIYLLGVGIEIRGGEVVAGVFVRKHEWVEKALHAGGNPNERLENIPISCLQYAFQVGDSAIARTLLAAGAKLGHDELVAALWAGDVDIIKEFVIPHVHRWNIPSDGESLLEAAMHPDNPSAEILELVDNICSKPYDAGSLCAAVQLAIRSGNSTDARRILNRRPRCREPDILEATAVSIAVGGGDRDLLQLLLHRLTPSTKSYIPHQFGSDPDNFQRRSFWREAGRCVSSPLVAAAGANKPELVSLMLASGYRADELSLCRAVDNGDRATAEIILKSTPLLPSCQIHEIRKPVQIAAHRKDVEMIRLLLDHGGNIEEWGAEDIDFTGTPLQLAAGQGDLKTVEFLLQHGSNINAPACTSRYGYSRVGTALQAAACGGHLAVAKRLLDHQVPARVDAHRPRFGPFGGFGFTALEGAAAHGRLDMVQLLLDHGAKTTGRGQRQYLHAIALAKEEGFDAIVALLLKARELDQDERGNVLNVERHLDCGYCSCSDCETESECGSDCDESGCIRQMRATVASNNEGFCTPPGSETGHYTTDSECSATDSDLDGPEPPTGARAIATADITDDQYVADNIQGYRNCNDWEGFIDWTNTTSNQGENAPTLLPSTASVEVGQSLELGVSGTIANGPQHASIFDFLDEDEYPVDKEWMSWLNDVTTGAPVIDDSTVESEI